MKFFCPKLPKFRQKSVPKKINKLEDKLKRHNAKIAKLIENNKNSITLQKHIIDEANNQIKYLEVELQQIKDLKGK